MILFKDVIGLPGIPLFSRFKMETPLQESLFLPADACYIYFHEGQGHVLEISSEIRAIKGTTILSTCGLTASGMIAHQSKGTLEITVVHFNAEVLKQIYKNAKPELWNELITPINQYLVQSSADKLITGYFNGILEFFVHKELVSEELLKLKLKEIIHLLLRSTNAPAMRKIVQSLFSERTFSFKEIVDAHLLTQATVENLAALTNCSISTFKRRFKEIYDDSPAKYLLKHRLKQVALDLKMSDDPISQIGYRYGFESPEHLSRAFKKEFSRSPSEYRKKNSVA